MRKAKVGQQYHLEIDEDLKDIPCPWVLNPKSRLHPKYVKWSDLHSEQVVVKAFTRLLTDYAIVELVNGPKEEFTVPAKCLLEITYRLPVICSCDRRDLLWRGCRCGAFKREQAAKTTQPR